MSADFNVFIFREQDKDDPNLLPAADRLRVALRPKHKTLFTHLSRIPGGVKFLVDLRADILVKPQMNRLKKSFIECFKFQPVSVKKKTNI